MLFKLVAIDDINNATDSYQNNGFRLYADHPTYVNTYNSADNILDVLILHPNYLGPITLLFLTNNNLYFIYIFNVAVFLISIAVTIRFLKINNFLYVCLLIINPILLISLFSVNKEIFALLSTSLFIVSLERSSFKFLVISIIISLCARKELGVFYLLIFITLRTNTLRTNFNWHKHSLLLYTFLIASISICGNYLSSNFEVFELYLNESEQAFNTVNSGGTINLLNQLQNKFGYWCVFLPKTALNLFGSIYRIDSIFVVNDVYNNVVIWVQSLLFIILIPLSISKLQRLDEIISRKLFFSFVVFCIMFSFIAIIQSRYFYPCYILLVIIICIKEKKYMNGES